MQCTNCEATLKETAKFCTSCGQSVNPDAVSVTIQDTNTNSEATEKVIMTIDSDEIMQHVSGYVSFLKETLIKPTSVFSMDISNWVLGLISIVVLSVIFSLNIELGFMRGFFFYSFVQAATMGSLYLINYFFSKEHHSFLEVIKNYGGLINVQIVLSLLMIFLDMDSGLFILLAIISVTYQMVYINYYILQSQSISKLKLSPYYQLLLGNIVFIILNIVIFNFAG